MCSAAGVVEEGHTAKWAAASSCIEYSDVFDATPLDPFDKSGVDRLQDIHFESIRPLSSCARCPGGGVLAGVQCSAGASISTTPQARASS